MSRRNPSASFLGQREVAIAAIFRGLWSLCQKVSPECLEPMLPSSPCSSRLPTQAVNPPAVLLPPGELPVLAIGAIAELRRHLIDGTNLRREVTHRGIFIRYDSEDASILTGSDEGVSLLIVVEGNQNVPSHQYCHHSFVSAMM